jgi:DNA mismatch repair protein MutS2
MDKNSLKVLELDKVLKHLSEFTKTRAGCEICLSLKPLTNFEEIKTNLKKVSEAKSFIITQGCPPISETEKAKKAIERAAISGLLNEEELLTILNKLKTLTAIKDSFKDSKDEFPLLSRYIDQIKLQKEIEKEIEAKIGEDGEVRTNATEDLSRIRKNIKETHNLIYSKLNELFNSQSYSRMFQENIITVRNNRYVIPLKSEFKTHFPCIVYDQSTSGETLFVEPLLITPLNNDYNILLSQEKREIDKILSALSSLVKEKAKELLASIEIEEELDIIFAKARQAIELDCSEPEMVDAPLFNIKGARHPLILKSEVVPIDVHLGEKFRTLIITGPNTGGKTVTLKTCGLLIAMSYCGLHIPASSQTKIGHFEDILADIGEEQDIEQSLSSFSSHLSNIIHILKLAKKDTLVLLDELGAGTDPDEGSALGMAIISYFHMKEVPQMITTHLSQIKSFAYNHNDAENACVGFNLESLKPTYKVLIGIPGQSHAFQIAKRLGLPEDLIETAEKYLSKRELEVKSLIEGLIKKSEEIEADKLTTESARMEAEELKNKYEKEVQNFESSIREKKRSLYQKTSEEIKEISERAKSLLKELAKKKEASSEAHKLYEEIRTIEEETENKLKEMEKAEKDFPPVQDSSEVSIGDNVWVRKYKLQGIIISKDEERNSVEVLMGSFRTILPITEIAKGEPFKTEDETVDTSGVKKRRSVPQKIDLHGLTVEEALPLLDKYLDDAYLSKLPIVYVMHGEGKGILRDNVKKFLLTHPHVRDFDSKDTFAIVYLK